MTQGGGAPVLHFASIAEVVCALIGKKRGRLTGRLVHNSGASLTTSTGINNDVVFVYSFYQ